MYQDRNSAFVISCFMKPIVFSLYLEISKIFCRVLWISLIFFFNLLCYLLLFSSYLPEWLMINLHLLHLLLKLQKNKIFECECMGGLLQEIVYISHLLNIIIQGQAQWNLIQEAEIRKLWFNFSLSKKLDLIYTSSQACAYLFSYEGTDRRIEAWGQSWTEMWALQEK
jgi:hypothetical protein